MTAVLVLALATSACGSDGEPQTVEAARATAQAQMDRHAAQDHGAVWDMWTNEAQDSITRNDYIALGVACDLGGFPAEVVSARLKSDTVAEVQIGVMGNLFPFSTLYEDGKWRWQPEADTLTT